MGLVEEIAKAIEEAEKYATCMSLEVSEDGKCVTLLLDTDLNTYSEWIPGEGADIGLVRCQETKRVVGVRLPLLKNNLAIFHEGPIRINAGFRKSDIT